MGRLDCELEREGTSEAISYDVALAGQNVFIPPHGESKASIVVGVLWRIELMSRLFKVSNDGDRVSPDSPSSTNILTLARLIQLSCNQRNSPVHYITLQPLVQTDILIISTHLSDILMRVSVSTSQTYALFETLLIRESMIHRETTNGPQHGGSSKV